MYPARLDVRSYGNVGIVTGPGVGVYSVKTSVEEVVETLMNAVCLAHDHRVTLCGRVADGCNSVDLKDIFTR